jgi:hypothetical protein
MEEKCGFPLYKIPQAESLVRAFICGKKVDFLVFLLVHMTAIRHKSNENK